MNASITDAGTARPANCGEEEWALRWQLAQCYHLVDFMGWSEAIFNHISARLPGPAHHYLVNPFGLNYTEITPANLLKVDLDGNKLAPSPHEANPAGFALHSAIHGARPDVQCVLHTHTTAVSAIVQKQLAFDYKNFYSAQLYGRVGFHAFEGITLFEDEKARMIASLGDKHILVLRNHGIAVAERSIATAFFLLWTVQRAADIQCQAGSLPGEDAVLSTDIRQRCSSLAAMLVQDQGFAVKFFDAMVRKMQAQRRQAW